MTTFVVHIDHSVLGLIHLTKYFSHYLTGGSESGRTKRTISTILEGRCLRFKGEMVLTGQAPFQGHPGTDQSVGKFRVNLDFLL